MRRLVQQSGPGPAGRHLAYVIASTIREARLAIGWSQAELAHRAGTSQSTESRIERGLTDRVDVAAIGRLFDALGSRLDLRVETPILADRRRQRDAAHARCVAYVARRLMAVGWATRREVEIIDGRSHGWIDVLGYFPQSGALLVVEVKTEIEDVGHIERAMAWYEREAPSAARRFGWNAHKIVGALIVLDTRATADRLRSNREAIAQSFPLRAEWLTRCVHGETANPQRPLRALAAIDPTSRRTTWLRPTVLDGRRSPAAYEDYAEFSRRLTQRQRIQDSARADAFA